MVSQKTLSHSRMATLLVAANFLAAFGSGLILGASEPFKKVGAPPAINTFVIGTTVGLLVFWLVRSRWTGRMNVIGGWFAVGSGFLSLLTAYFLNSLSEAIIGFWLLALLTARFCLWFVARVLRPDAVAGRKQRIGWVELSYYLGMVSGLLTIIVQPWTVRDTYGAVAVVMMIDGILQLASGSLDLVAQKLTAPAVESVATSASEVDPLPYNLGWYVRMVTTVVGLTIGTQAIIFSFIGVVTLPEGLKTSATSLILFVFYVSVACGSIFYVSKKMRLEWPEGRRGFARFATILIGERDIQKKIPFPLLSAIGAGTLAISIYVSSSHVRDRAHVSYLLTFFLLLFLATAALIYEVMALAIFDHIGAEMKKLNRNGMVALAYCFMGAGVTITLLLTETQIGDKDPFADVRKIQMHSRLLWILLACSAIANLAFVSSSTASKVRAGWTRRVGRRAANGRAVSN